MWTCPHCGTAQAAAPRCWVCHRASTTCSTCRHFRTSLAADVGWCALDRRRRHLTGLELRGCWTERPTAAATATGRTPAAPDPTWRDVPVRGFVPVGGPGANVAPPVSDPPTAAGVPPLAGTPLLAADPQDSWAGRVSLFGDLER